MDLDNPLWGSLITLHRSLAIGVGKALRYPAAVAPFIAIQHPGPAPLLPGETLYMIGPQPQGAESLGPILQMVCEAAQPLPHGPPILALDETHRPEVLALTALVYPHYFRPRTMDLGRYFGIFADGRLAAMIGERMGMPGAREISAVCTHPESVGRGLARRLLAFLGNELLARGELPFLHVSPSNARALKLYEANGWRVRKQLPFWRCPTG
jgi:ribosomal protein S18 acetylase RimI-like enzyme